MPRWVPEPLWEGEDAYVVGGGPSLQGFDWELLRGKHVVGCNSVALVSDSAAVLEAVIFGDHKWWLDFGRDGLPAFGGLVVAAVPKLRDDPTPWLLWAQRLNRGLATDGRLGWNDSTGAAAVNLALALGARRVFLLGIDLKGDRNWHDLRVGQINQNAFYVFAAGFAAIAADLPRKFPGREIVNVTDVGSLAGVFPVQSVEAHFALEKVGAS